MYVYKSSHINSTYQENGIFLYFITKVKKIRKEETKAKVYLKKKLSHIIIITIFTEEIEMCTYLINPTPHGKHTIINNNLILTKVYIHKTNCFYDA